MTQNERDQAGRHGVAENRATLNAPTSMAAPSNSDEEVITDVDEPPDDHGTPRPSVLKLHNAFQASFSKTAPNIREHKESLLTHALHSDAGSPTEEHSESAALSRGMSCASTWS